MKKRFRMAVGLLLMFFALAALFSCATLKKKTKFDELVNLIDMAEKNAAQGDYRTVCETFMARVGDRYFPSRGVGHLFSFKGIVEESGIKVYLNANPEDYFDFSPKATYEVANKDAKKILSPLLRRAESILKKSIEGLDYQKLKATVLRLQSDFPRFCSFLQSKGISIPSNFFIIRTVYSDHSESLYRFIEQIDEFGVPSLVDKIKTQMSDFDFHDAMEVLEKDCYENLSKIEPCKLYQFKLERDPSGAQWGVRVYPNYDEKKYYFDFEDMRNEHDGKLNLAASPLFSPLSVEGTDELSLYSDLKEIIGRAGIKFRYNFASNNDIFTVQLASKDGKWHSKSKDCAKEIYEDYEYGFLIPVMIWKGLIFDDVPDGDKDKYELEIIGFRSKKSQSNDITPSSAGGSGQDNSSDSGLKSLFGSVMCEVCGEHLALYEAFDPVKNKRVSFCRSCLEKRQQDDNAKLQKALEQLRIL